MPSCLACCRCRGKKRASSVDPFPAPSLVGPFIIPGVLRRRGSSECVVHGLSLGSRRCRWHRFAYPFATWSMVTWLETVVELSVFTSMIFCAHKRRNRLSRPRLTSVLRGGKSTPFVFARVDGPRTRPGTRTPNRVANQRCNRKLAFWRKSMDQSVSWISLATPTATPPKVRTPQTTQTWTTPTGPGGVNRKEAGVSSPMFDQPRG